MGKKSDEEYQEAMRLAAQYRESKKSAWTSPRTQRKPNERAQYVEKSIFGSENRYDGRAASRASKKGKR